MILSEELDPMNVSAPEPNRHPETRRSRRASAALLAVASVAAAAAACDSAEDAGGRGDLHAGLAVLEQELGAVDGPPEQAFASIGDFLVTAEGEVWVLDGIGSRLSPRIRTEGGYLGDVGREGGGPGEFRRPYALAQLPDGRVVVRDQLAPDRLLLFGPHGAYNTTWTFEHPLSNVAGNPSVMRVGESGVLWVEHRSGSRPDPTTPPEPSVFYARIGPEGAVLDTVVPPEAPDVEPPELLAGLIVIPFQPRAIASWTPWGSFATGRTDTYDIRITRVPAPGAAPESAGEGREVPSTLTISRPAEPVRVGAEEAEAARGAPASPRNRDGRFAALLRHSGAQAALAGRHLRRRREAVGAPLGSREAEAAEPRE